MENIFILFGNNGESYEDRQDFNLGVFSSAESAFEYLKTSGEIPAFSDDVEIQGL